MNPTQDRFYARKPRAVPITADLHQVAQAAAELGEYKCEHRNAYLVGYLRATIERLAVERDAFMVKSSIQDALAYIAAGRQLGDSHTADDSRWSHDRENTIDPDWTDPPGVDGYPLGKPVAA